MTELSVGERIREVFDGLDMKSAMRVVFGKCPNCGEKLVRGYWLRWCEDRTCPGYVEPLNKDLAEKIAFVKPETPQQKAAMDALAKLTGVPTS